jgi:protein-disulfide isomerase
VIRLDRSSRVFAFIGVWSVASIATSIALVREATARSVRPSATYVAAFPAYASSSDGYASGNGLRLVIVLTDFVCPICRQAAVLEDSLVTADSSIRLVELDVPVWNSNGYMAALAARCARDQMAFSVARATLFRVDTLVFARQDWNQLADALHVRDRARFLDCVTEVRHAPAVEAAISRAMRLGPHTNPSVIVADSLYSTPTLDSMRVVLAARNH